MMPIEKNKLKTIGSIEDGGTEKHLNNLWKEEIVCGSLDMN